MNMGEMVSKMFVPVIAFFQTLLAVVSMSVLGAVVVFFVLFFLLCKINPFRPELDKLRSMTIRFLPYNLLRWLFVDFITRKERVGIFHEYGFTIYCGRQGSGKTISMVNYLNAMHEEYPDCMIVTNFWYEHASFRMTSWRDFLEIRNGTDGVIFAIDEIQSEYNADSWKDFPEAILSEISMQRKQRLKIVATSQVYSRVVKQIREQTFSVVMCDTYFGRFTRNKEYDAAEYSTGDTPYMLKKKCRPISKRSFVQSDELRQCYDTYEKIERMKHLEFIPRKDRGN